MSDNVLVCLLRTTTLLISSTAKAGEDQADRAVTVSHRRHQCERENQYRAQEVTIAVILFKYSHECERQQSSVHQKCKDVSWYLHLVDHFHLHAGNDARHPTSAQYWG